MTFRMNDGTPARRAGRRLARLAALVLALGSAGCELDLDNPNALSEEDVFTDPNGIVALAVGMQSQYATSFGDYARGPALITDEWGSNTGSLASYQSLVSGQSFDRTFGVVNAPWESTYRVVRTANSILGNLDGVDLDAGTAAGVRALARTYKAMALGMSIMQYEEIPVDVTVANPVPQPRAVVLDSITALLEAARTDLAAGPDLSTFQARVLVPGIVLPDVINAMLARYYLLDQEYAKAIEAAQRVPLSARSEFRYTGTSSNPIWNIAFSSIYVQPLASFRARAETGDQRVTYWAVETATATRGNPDSLLIPFRRYADRNAPIPVYLPDEMRLIQAEAYARTGNLPQARTLINAVRTQCSTTPATATEPVACLPELPVDRLDTLDEVLDQIAYERRYELFSQGLRWEDLRRLGTENSVGAPPTLTWFPIPSQECRTNPAAECVP